MPRERTQARGAKTTAARGATARIMTIVAAQATIPAPPATKSIATAGMGRTKSQCDDLLSSHQGTAQRVSLLPLPGTLEIEPQVEEKKDNPILCIHLLHR